MNFSKYLNKVFALKKAIAACRKEAQELFIYKFVDDSVMSLGGAVDQLQQVENRISKFANKISKAKSIDTLETTLHLSYELRIIGFLDRTTMKKEHALTQFGNDEIELMSFKGPAYEAKEYASKNDLVYFEKDVSIQEELPLDKVI